VAYCFILELPHRIQFYRKYAENPGHSCRGRKLVAAFKLRVISRFVARYVRPFDLINELKRNPHYGALCAQAA
jgi:hypothetical protein